MVKIKVKDEDREELQESKESIDGDSKRIWMELEAQGGTRAMISSNQDGLDRVSSKAIDLMKKLTDLHTTKKKPRYTE